MSALLLRIQEYRQKYYQNRLLKGLIFTAALLLTAFLAVNAIEYFGRFSSTVRGMLFFGFLALFLFSLYQWIIQPLISLYGLRKPLSDENAALQIGQYFPEIGDKLLNTLQLQSLSGQQTDLIEASIRQKSGQLLIVRFSDAIKFQENKQYVKYAVYPLAAIAVILLFNPTFFTSSSDRIIHFQKNYTYAPFSFKLNNENLKVFRNEDFTLNLTLEGEALPQSVYLVQNGTRFKLTPEGNRDFSYTFKNVQRDASFSFDAAGFTSDSYELSVIERPSLLSFDVNLRYPSYLNKPAERLSNVGNLTVPEGTVVEWNFNTSATKSLGIRFENDTLLYKAKNQDDKNFQYQKPLRRSSQYEVLLQNNETPNAEKIGYYINVIPDKHPVLSLENFQDTTLYNYLVVGGSISDDYGFTQLKLFYTVRRDDQPEDKNPVQKSISMPFNKTVNTQSFYFQWYVDSLKLAPGDKIEYFAQVWDNDGVNGAKSARSRIINFTIPSKDKLQEEVEKSAQETAKQMEDALKKAQSLERDLENLEKRLKTNKELDFQERKQAEEILKKREALMEEIRSIQDQNKATNEKSQQ
ncbi:MAG: ATPase, partial [Bacteroidetes bacterium]|nr:ATPase [Bacteroidota bacterium]